MKYVSLILSIICLPILSFASGGASGGNGGFAVVCFNQAVDRTGAVIQSTSQQTPLKIVSVSLQDVWEWAPRFSYQSMLVSENTYVEKIRELAHLIKKSDHKLSQRLYEGVYKNFSNIRWLGVSDDSDINDAYELIDGGKNCYLKQIALFRFSPMFGEYPIDIQKDLFDRLSEDEKAQTITHEYLWEDVFSHSGVLGSLDNLRKTSKNLRLFNYLLTTQSGIWTNPQVYNDTKYTLIYSNWFLRPQFSR